MKLTVETKNGPVKGFEQGGVRVFKGIPYAEGYTQQGRFRSARPCGKHNEPFCADHFPPAAFQLPKKVGGVSEGATMAEESLCVNVWTPDTKRQNLPVVVWLYGGAFVSGDCSDDMYDGVRLAEEHELVVVTLNYRINALGFLDFSSFLPDAESNVGLKDQTLALEWIYENIEAFGGDKENITLSGQSAGGFSVLALLSASSARKFITKAVAMSPYPISVNTKEQAAAHALRFLEILGLSPKEAGELYNIPGSMLAIAAKTLEEEICAQCGFDFAFTPVIDGEFLPCSPIKAAQSAGNRVIPLVIGTVEDEGSLYALTPVPLFPTTKETIRKFLDSNPDFESKGIQEYYSRVEEKRRMDKMGGDILFGVPGLLYADNYSRHSPVWVYRFTYYSLGLKLKKLYCMHGTDVPFAFNNLKCTIAKNALKLTPVKIVPNGIKREFSAFIAEFAKTGRANFEPYTEKRRVSMEFGRKIGERIHPLCDLTEEFKKTGYFRSKLEL